MHFLHENVKMSGNILIYPDYEIAFRAYGKKNVKEPDQRVQRRSEGCLQLISYVKQSFSCEEDCFFYKSYFRKQFHCNLAAE